jgi:two-component system, NarL family, response regulator NreC
LTTPTPLPERPIRVLVADDHRMARSGLCMLLRLEPDLEIVGEADDGHAALALAAELRPDVLLADVSMPGPGGIELARQLRDTLPDVHVVVLTMHEDSNLVREALTAGAYGYIIKRTAESDLVAAVHASAAGEVYVDRQMRRTQGAEAAARPTTPLPAAGGAQLTPAEVELLRLLGRGLSMQQITAALGMEPDRVECMRQDLAERLGLRTRVAIMRYVREHDLLSQ